MTRQQRWATTKAVAVAIGCSLVLLAVTYINAVQS